MTPSEAVFCTADSEHDDETVVTRMQTVEGQE